MDNLFLYKSFLEILPQLSLLKFQELFGQDAELLREICFKEYQLNFRDFCADIDTLGGGSRFSGKGYGLIFATALEEMLKDYIDKHGYTLVKKDQ